ncbi:MAG: reverse transcriptase family protein [Shewanella sp.]
MSPPPGLELQNEAFVLNCRNNIYKENDFLKIVSINAQSIAEINHMTILRHYLSNKIVDIAGISETWLKAKHDNAQMYDIDGYELVRNDRPETRGGGVAFYIRKGLAYEVICNSHSDPNEAEGTEYLIVSIKLKLVKLMACILYRRPHYSVHFNNLITDLKEHSPDHDQCVVMGDFNCNFAKDSPLLRSLNFETEELGLERLAIQNTHMVCNTSTTINAIFLSNDCDAINYGKLENLLSHHSILYVTLSLATEATGPKCISIREFDKIDKALLVQEAMKIEWVENEQTALDDRVINFNNKLLGLFDKVAPVKTIQVTTKFKPTLPQDIKEMVRKRNAAKKHASRVCTIDAFHIFKMLRNRVKQLILNFHKSIIFSSLEKIGNTQHVWSKLRKLGLVKDKNKTCSLPIDSNQLVKELTVHQSSEILDQIEKNVEIPLHDIEDQFYFKYVTPLEVKCAINQITSPSEGTDKICIKMLKLCVDIILPVLTFIINTSLQTCSFPTVWKKSILKPIPKVRKPETASDFRPISILCVVSKVLEKLVYDQLLEYLNSKRVFDKLQSGFRKMHSTATALLKITEDLRMAIFKGNVTLMVFLDYSKAFDLVDHTLLLKKLRKLNLSEPAVQFFNSYLSNRSHAIKNDNGSFSEWVKIECGVPQGSVLGPLLFSLFIHDLASVIGGRCNYHLYADDLQLYMNFSCKPDDIAKCVATVNEILADVSLWSQKQGLKLNPKKSQAMIIGSERTYKKLDFSQIPNITLDGVILDYCDKFKNLGIVFDKHLNWNGHISQITQKFYGVLKNLQKFRDATPESIRIRLVKSLILPHFDYCDMVYCNITAAQINKLQILQNNAIRYIFDVKRGQRLSVLYKKANILNITDRRKLSLLCQTHKILYKNCPDYLKDFATTMMDVNLGARTRAHRMTLLAPFVSVEVPENSFKVACYRMWNALRPNLCLNANVNAFKSAIKKDLFAEY